MTTDIDIYIGDVTLPETNIAFRSSVAAHFGCFRERNNNCIPPLLHLGEVLSAVGCSYEFPEFSVTRVPPVKDLWHLEHGVSIAYYMATRKELMKKAPEPLKTGKVCSIQR